MADGPVQDADGNSPFDNIVDDESVRNWAAAEIGSGRSVEEIVTDLVAAGWSHEFAQEACEDARRRTRHQRGITTREDAARAFGANNAMGDSAPYRGGGLIEALANFLHALARLWSTRHVGRRK
jgi:hypothetical protein